MSDEAFLRWILPGIFLLCGLGLLCATALNLARTRAFLRTAAEAAGEVIGHEEEPACEPGDPRTYRSVVAFTVGARSLRFSSQAHSHPPEHAVGDAVRVLYDPARPGDARIRSFTGLWLLPSILGGLGVVFTALGAWLLSGGLPA